MAFRLEHLRCVLEREPERRDSLAAAVERFSRMLAAISGGEVALDLMFWPTRKHKFGW